MDQAGTNKSSENRKSMENPAIEKIKRKIRELQLEDY